MRDDFSAARGILLGVTVSLPIWLLAGCAFL